MTSELPPLPERFDLVLRMREQVPVWHEDDMRAYAQTAVLAEREACAKVCEAQETSKLNAECPSAVPKWWPDQVAHRCAAAIRARE